jgi:hypothetical protein
MFFYDKYENRKYEIDPRYGSLKDDIGGGPDFNPKFCFEGKLYSWTTTQALREYTEGEYFAVALVLNSQKKEYLKNLALSLSKTDNPVLIIVTPKN